MKLFGINLSRQAVMYGLIALLALFIVPLLGNKLFERNDTGEILVIQDPLGGVTVHTDPGIKMQWFGRSTSYRKENDFEFRKQIMFSDKGKGTIVGSFRYRLPEDKKTIERLHASYPSELALHSSLIGNTVDRAVFTTGPLMTSDESASSRRNDLLYYIEDQAKRGTYRTLRVSEKREDPVSGKEVTVTLNVISRDSVTNEPILAATSATAEYDIELYKLTIDTIRYDRRIEEQLARQVEAQMAVQSSIVQAQTAEQDALKAEAEGRRRVAEAEANKAVELANTVANARKDSIEAAIKLTTAQIEAQRTRVEADAQAYENRLLVQAGLTPKEQADYRMKTAIGIAEQLAKRPVPSIVAGGNDGSGGDPTQVLMLRMLEKYMKEP